MIINGWVTQDGILLCSFLFKMFSPWKQKNGGYQGLEEGEDGSCSSIDIEFQICQTSRTLKLHLQQWEYVPHDRTVTLKWLKMVSLRCAFYHDYLSKDI